MRYGARQTLFCHSGLCFALLTHYGPRKSKFWKNKKKHSEIFSFYKYVPKMTVIWCMVRKIWSVTDKIFYHFGPFFALLPSSNLKNQNFEKMKKPPGGITILHRCNINDNHIMYSSRDIECDRQKFLLFWTVFPLLPS